MLKANSPDVSPIQLPEHWWLDTSSPSRSSKDSLENLDDRSDMRGPPINGPITSQYSLKVNVSQELRTSNQLVPTGYPGLPVN
jgi:hypothetical protein